MFNPLRSFTQAIRTVAISIGILLLISCNVRLYSSPAEQNDYEQIDALLNEFQAKLERGVARNMQVLFPEGYYFSYVLYGLSRVNLGLQGIESERMLAEARAAYQALDSEMGRRPFPAELNPPYGIFYQGWRNYLLAGILLLQETPDPDELAHFQTQSQQIANAIAASPHPFLPSYHSQIWPVDTFPAVVSLRAHTRLIDDRHEPLIEEWLVEIDAYRDPSTDLLPHKINAQSGAMIDGARATSQTLMLRFFAEIDPQRASVDYARFQEQFVVSRAGLPGVREYPTGINRLGDVDSGPLITGVSLSATAVMLGTARVLGDDALGERLWISAETIGIPAPTRNGRHYLASTPFSIGNIFAAWSASSQPWLISAPIQSSSQTPPLWRLPLHILSLLTLIALALWLLRYFKIR